MIDKNMLNSVAILEGKICPYCQKPTVHMPDTEIYTKSYGSMIYICYDCNAYVGCHKSNPTRALGRIANEELRRWKIKAHAAFDSLWKRKINDGFKKHESRGKAYKWLSLKMGIDPEFCHIGMFDINECKMVIEICEPYIK